MILGKGQKLFDLWHTYLGKWESLSPIIGSKGVQPSEPRVSLFLMAVFLVWGLTDWVSVEDANGHE